ncbi:FHA domain-containing protein [Caldimonas tepidiphila]|uniref:FHA domain-containing protein n=1 Tax=Caldimonas tepidiphila TaxID=2315841 RepID=UPI000E5B91E2|nr:FHA domain-containing protein [Caldimonas tepidiphila]
MGKLVVSLDGVVIKEVQLTKDKTTLGRRPYNDIVIDNLAVSGEHAVLQVVGRDVFIEDINSTNGTYVNGKPIRKQLLTPSDTVEIGKYKLCYVSDDPPDLHESLRDSSTAPAGFAHTAPYMGGPSGFGGLGSSQPPSASIKVLNGAAAGRQVLLTKVVTTIGKPGVQVGSISRRPGGYVLAHVEGPTRPTVNGVPVEADPVPLSNGDIIELAGTRMQFVLG